MSGECQEYTACIITDKTGIKQKAQIGQWWSTRQIGEVTYVGATESRTQTKSVVTIKKVSIDGIQATIGKTENDGLGAATLSKGSKIQSQASTIPSSTTNML